MKNRRKKQFTIASATKNIKYVVDQLELFLSDLPLSDQCRDEAVLAVAEAIANAIIHGNKKNPQKHVTVTFEWPGSQFRVTVCDEGVGFDPTKVPSPLTEKNRLKTSGRGIYLMKVCMDSVSFNQTATGMLLRMIKKIRQKS
ncbi:ATP-binding protein [bacterium]|nr:ATP-binding protein [bacterium]